MNLRSLFLPLLLFTINASAQYFHNYEDQYEKITSESGISLNSVNCFLKDKTGFIWLGTKSGLNRFDSKNIVNFDLELSDEKTLNNLCINDLHQDINDNIWIATDFGLYMYSPTQEIITNPYDLFVDKRIQVYDIEKESDSTFWLATSLGIRQVHLEKGVINSYKNEPYQPNSLSSTASHTICNDGEKLWIGTDNGLDLFDKKKESFNHFTNENTNGTLTSNRVRCLVRKSNGILLIGTEQGGFIVFDSFNGIFEAYTTSNSALPHNDIRDIHIGPKGDIWIATNGGGVCTYNETSGIQTYTMHDPDKPNGLNTNGIYSIFEDIDGTLWLGTYSGGINFNTARSNNFKTLKHIPYNTNSICENSVRSIHLDSQNNLWLGTMGGLSYYDTKNQNFTSYIHNKDQSSLSFNTVTSVFEDSQGRVWVGTYSGGLNLFNKRTKTFKHYKHKTNDIHTIPSNNIFAFTESNDGTIWIATTEGISFYNSKNDNFERVGNISTRDICALENGDLLLGINGGVATYTPKTGAFEYYTSDLIDPFPVNSILLSENKTAWLGSEGTGLTGFDLKEKTFKNFKEEQGLPSNFVNCVLPYKEEKLWISTYNGISLFDTKNETFTNFGLEKGLQISEFHPKSGVILPNGDYAFGGTQGLLFFSPDQVAKSTNQSNLVLTGFSIDNVMVSANSHNSPLTKNINEVEEIKLDYSENDFSIEFVDIDMISKGRSRYMYRLKNFNHDWVHIGNRDMAAFTNIKPGKYTFQLKTDNSDSIKEVQIFIKAPFWMQWYFFVLISLLLIGLIIMYNKYALISVNQRNKMQLEKVELESQTELHNMRTRFFTYISHELRTPLTLILDPLRKAIEKNLDPEVDRAIIDRDLKFVSKNTQRLLKLTDQIIDFRKIENDALKLQVENTSISAIVNDIYQSFNELAQDHKLKYTSNIEENVTGWVDRDKIEKIMYNLLNNAFKFTKEGSITVALQLVNGGKQIEISIQDTGKGIAKNKRDKIFELFFQDVTLKRNMEGSFGLGLSYVHRLVKLHHGKISVDSAEGIGSTFKVVLPILEEKFSENERCVIIESPETNTVETHKQRRDMMKDHNKEEIKFKDHDRNTPKIVIVEDEKQLRDYFYISIAPKYKVYTAEDGEEGLKLIKKVMPDLILSDNMMPGMNGTELCQEVKKDIHLEHIPFVLISAWNSDDQKASGLKVGAIDYISKPLDIDLLLMKIDSILSDQKKLKKASKSTIDIAPEEPEVETEDVKFLKDAVKLIEENIDSIEFNATIFEKNLYMSHAVLYRKLKRLTGMSSNEFIRDFRMKRAIQLLDKYKDMKVADVGFKVGYDDTKYFSQCFKKHHGITPTEYKKRQAQNNKE